MSGRIDGGSSVTGKHLVRASQYFKDSRAVTPARIGAVIDSRPTSPRREASLLTGPAVRPPQSPVGPFFQADAVWPFLSRVLPTAMAFSALTLLLAVLERA